jgi:hypothetical protein
MAAPTAITDIGRYSVGDRILHVALITGGTTLTAASINLNRIETAWFQDVDDANPIQVSAYSGTSITFEEITAGKKQLVFVIGYE